MRRGIERRADKGGESGEAFTHRESEKVESDGASMKATDTLHEVEAFGVVIADADAQLGERLLHGFHHGDRAADEELVAIASRCQVGGEMFCEDVPGDEAAFALP